MCLRVKKPLYSDVDMALQQNHPELCKVPVCGAHLLQFCPKPFAAVEMSCRQDLQHGILSLSALQSLGHI